MMKKTISLLLAILLMVSLFTACGGEEAKEPEVSEKAPVTEEVAPSTENDKAEEVVADSTPLKPEEKPADKTEKAPEENKSEEKQPEAPTTKPAAPATTKPAATPEKPAEKPKEETTTPVEKPAVKEYSIEEVHTIIKNTYGADYRPNVAIPKETLKDQYGVNPDDIDSYIAEQPMISANIDTFIAIKAKSGKAASVASALNAYKSGLLEGSMMYPSNMPKAQAAKVITHGDFVFLVMLGAAGDMEADEATQLAFAKAQVEKGVNAINKYFTK